MLKFSLNCQIPPSAVEPTVACHQPRLSTHARNARAQVCCISTVSPRLLSVLWCRDRVCSHYEQHAEGRGSSLYRTPAGPDLNPDECRELDDGYLLSDPTGYFRAKLESLLDEADSAGTPTVAEGSLRARFQQISGEAAHSRSPVTAEQRNIQVAVDAIQFRHQVAEALLRLIEARLTQRDGPPPQSLWMNLIKSPTRLHDLLEKLRPHVESEEFGPIAAGLLIPAPAGTTLDEDMRKAVSTAWDWVVRAIEIVMTGHVDLNAANNKIKHGVTARPEDRLRLTIATKPPNEDGSMPLSHLTGPSSFDVFDTIVLEYISRPPKLKGQEPHGYERTLLRADAPVLLAEAWMLAIIHGAVFHTSAYRHFGEKTVEGMAPHPGLLIGPTPQRILGQHVVGMRFPVTTSPQGKIHRPPGMLLSDGVFVPMKFDNGRRMVVVDG